MANRDVVKTISRYTLMFGSSRIVGSVVKNNVPVNNLFQKITVGTTTFVIGGMLTDLTAESADRKIDILFDALEGKKELKIV